MFSKGVPCISYRHFLSLKLNVDPFIFMNFPPSGVVISKSSPLKESFFSRSLTVNSELCCVNCTRDPTGTPRLKNGSVLKICSSKANGTNPARVGCGAEGLLELKKPIFASVKGLKRIDPHPPTFIALTGAVSTDSADSGATCNY